MRQRIIALIVLACATASSSDAAPVRIFAAGQKHDMSDVVTYQTFHDKMAALVDATFPGRAGLVQAGVDDVASHLAPVDPAAPANALVAFPEDTGLFAAFIGTRGASARAQGVTTDAILNLFVSYAPQRSYYQTKYPGQPTIRYLVLALTDTFYRSVYETFRELAMTHGVLRRRRRQHAAGPARRGGRRPHARRQAARSGRADAPVRLRGDRAVRAEHHLRLRAERRDRRCRWQRRDALRSEPDRWRARRLHVEGVPRPDRAATAGSGAGLALSTNPVRNQEVLDTPVGKLAIVISKDAWMVDVNDRFVMKGANVVIQPEAFDSWAFTTAEWSPDVFREGGLANVQKNPEWVVNVDPSVTGNLFEITFDGQTSVTGRKQKVAPGPLSSDNAWIGQNPDTALLAVAPWIVPDPGIASPAMTLADRRAALVADGVKLLPGSGVDCGGPLVVGACENGYREAVVWADVDVPTSATTSAPDPTRVLPPSFRHRGAGERARGDTGRAAVAAHRGQRAASIRRVGAGRRRGQVDLSRREPRCRRDLRYAAARERQSRRQCHGNEPVDRRPGRQGLRRLAGVHESRQRRCRADHDGPLQRQAREEGFRRARRRPGRRRQMDAEHRVRGLEAGGRLDRRARRRARGRAAGARLCGARFRGRRFVRPVDPRRRGHSGGARPPQREQVGADDRGQQEADPDRLGGLPNYQWDIFSARSANAGLSFETNVRVDDSPNFERVNERPSVGIDRRGTVHVAWTDLRNRQPDTNIFYARSFDRGATFSPNIQLDDSKVGFDVDTDTPTNQWYPSLAADDTFVGAAWQDNRLGNNDVFFASSANGGVTFNPSERVDDTGGGHSEQTRPSLALGGRGSKRVCHVVWEDSRNGDRDIYLASRPCPVKPTRSFASGWVGTRECSDAGFGQRGVAAG
jgi:hypothetical protein